MKYDCELIKDIMPIYIDDALSDKSREIVEQHLDECTECSHFYKSIRNEPDMKSTDLIIQDKTLAYAKRIKKIRKTIISFIAIMFIGMTWMAVSILGGKYDTFVVKMGSYEEAKGHIERGWVPEEIPQDSKDISIIYNIDSNNVNGVFHTSQGGVESLINQCRVATVKDLSKTDKPLNKEFKKAKEELISSPEKVIFLQDDTYILAVKEDGIVFYFAK